jgi:hypothetical protein
MSSDFATYLIRSLLSEGRLRYERVEKTKDGFVPRLIEREGPTGLKRLLRTLTFLTTPTTALRSPASSGNTRPALLMGRAMP